MAGAGTDVDEGAHTVVVVAGGDPLPSGLADRLPPADLVVAADSGIEHALGLGWRVDVAVGDFDSVDPAALAAVERSGARVERHPVAKDATDLELALEEAVRAGATRIVVVGGHGGRLDHLLANALALAAPALAAVAVEAHLGDALVHVVRPGAPAAIHGDPGELVTLLPVGGAAHGVTTDGLRFPLTRESLGAGVTRGVSNVLERRVALVSLEEGVVLAVLPGALADGRPLGSDPTTRR